MPGSGKVAKRACLAWVAVGLLRCGTTTAQAALSPFSTSVMAAHPSIYLDFNDQDAALQDLVSRASFRPSDTGVLAAQQPGFDSTDPGNRSVSLSYNAFLSAPGNATGDYEWNEPFSIMMQIDDLEYSGGGTMYFVSKGNLQAGDRPAWALTMSMHSGAPQLCFSVYGTGGRGSNSTSQPSVCTHPGQAVFANGFNYHLVVTNDGTGSPGALQLSINGTQPPYLVYENNSLYRFGAVVVSIAKAGAGYADSTAFSSSGGGDNCNVSGSVVAQNGLAKSLTYTSNWGCTSTPTIEVQSKTGSGMQLSTTLFGSTMSTRSTYPLVVGGAEIDGKREGIGGTATGTVPQFIDEFAVFPSVLTPQEIQRLFYQTKFYQRLLKPVPAAPPVVVFDNDGCADPDNIYSLALTIAANQLGYVRLAGVVDTDGSGASMGTYRQMLDRAHLQAVPLGIPSRSVESSSLCTAADVEAVDPSTPQTAGAYEDAAALYRLVLSEHPKDAVDIVLGGSFRGVSDLMESAPDSVSGMTGAALVARNARNGGAIYAQGLGCCGTFTGDNSLQDWTAGQYVVMHNGSLPIFWFGGSPQVSGPGVLMTRDATDPVFLFAKHLGTDVRQAYDSLPVAALISSAFAGGVKVKMTGEGQGYAATTLFASSSWGGARCAVSGSVTAVNGVPSAVNPGDEPYAGIGSGCSSAPTLRFVSPTGTGASLEAVTTMSCGTVAISGPHAGTTSDALCSHHYFLPYSSLAEPGRATLLTWFINSLIDPEP